MIDKLVADVHAAVAGLESGSTVLVSGFGESGTPYALLEAVLELGVTDLTIVANNAGVGEHGIAALLRERRVRKLICSYPRSSGSVWFERRYRAGEVELDLVPQGTLTERIRAGGAGIGAFYTRTGADTDLAEGKETRQINGQTYVLETPIVGDFALVSARTADRWGNLTYRTAARNYGPTMVAAARTAVVEVERYVDLGAIDPEHVVTPGVYVDRVVVVEPANLLGASA